MKFQREEVIILVKANSESKVPDKIEDAQEYYEELNALINGDDFCELLVNKIEHFEGEKKAIVRKKYSRDIRDMFARLSAPIDNVFSASGTIKKYQATNEQTQMQVLEKLSSVRDGKSIQNWLKQYYIPIYKVDPNGAIFMEYKSKPALDVYPTYKCSDSIRNFELKGQNYDWILFESIDAVVNGKTIKRWRLVDDSFDYTIDQDGSSYVINDELSFPHPFGTCPGFIASDIVDPFEEIRRSPFHDIIPLSKEIAQNTSIKTIFKMQSGFPWFWRYINQCEDCRGTGKEEGQGDYIGMKVTCRTCDGKGEKRGKDVSDEVTLPVPEADGVKLAPDIAGYISPPIDFWKQATEELIYLERLAEGTLWGTTKEKQVQKTGSETATGRWLDVQPLISKLDKYSDAVEWAEWFITHMVQNIVDVLKPKDKSFSKIIYGRRFIIESPDVLTERYASNKKNNLPSTVLDRDLEEIIMSKYKNDPEWLGLELKKMKVEPYIHFDINQVSLVYGKEEAQKKLFFQSWWALLTDKDLMLDEYQLREKFNSEFKPIKIEQNGTSGTN